jgi:hypothetical protein
MRPLHRRAAAAAAGVVLATLSGTSLGASQLFKCIEGGRTVYQQQACSVSSQPEPAASAPRITAKASAAGGEPVPRGSAEAAPPGTRKVKPASPASAAPATPR